MTKSFFFSTLLFLYTITLFSQNTAKQQWVDSVYQELSIEERFGQLLMVRANQSYKPYNPDIEQYIKDYGIGGVCFFAAKAEEQLEQMNQWQSLSKTPMIIGIDAEWGLGMRLKNTISYPFQMTLGAIEDDSLIYEMGYQIGKECQRIGVQLNFAPVVDINNNPKNPVINSRSFGDNPQRVAEKAAMYMAGLQDAGIIATAKHFPGHGDTGSDSHKTLPVVNHPKERLKEVELYPFQQLINKGLSGIMVAHLYVPAYENEKNLASTLSPKIVTKLLKEEMGFQGLVVTDALDMKGVTKYFPSGEIEVKAMLAGNDILLLPENIPAAIEGLKNAYQSGRISKNLLKTQCQKILSYKYDLGLNNWQAIEEKNLIADLNSRQGLAIKEKLFENAITLIQNKEHILPFIKQTKQDLAVVSFGLDKNSAFEKYAGKYTDATFIYLPKSLSISESDSINQILNDFETVIFNIGHTSIFPQKSFGITTAEMELINQAANKTKTIVNLLGSPLAVQKFFNKPEKYHAFIVSYQDNEMTQKLSAEMIFGALAFKGNMPVKVSESIPTGYGIHTKSWGLIKYGRAENVGIDGARLEKEIDSIVEVGIKMKAFPGCQISIAKDGYIIFEKNYGYQTYDSIISVKSHTIYDIASITKVAASIPSLMYYYDQKKINLDAPLSSYINYLENSNKADLTLRNILTHQARLTPWIPFYWYNMDSTGHLNPEVFQTHQDDIFSIRVAENVYIKENYKYKIYDTIIKSDLRDKVEYKYSDLGYFFVPQIIANFSNLPINEFVDQQFYQSLNLQHTTYHPRQYFNLLDIAPTEKDTLFRKQTIRGDVHDPGAAMLGGVCGHAGLFSTAEDLTILFQMYLQKGYYGNHQYFDTATITEFTRYQFDGNDNRRALGFDKPYKKYDKLGPVCESTSLQSFGHSGFTGTYVWADPKNQTVYVFLSNRVYPRSDNYKISKFDFRTNIHQALYNAEK